MSRAFARGHVREAVLLRYFVVILARLAVAVVVGVLLALERVVAQRIAEAGGERRQFHESLMGVPTELIDLTHRPVGVRTVHVRIPRGVEVQVEVLDQTHRHAHLQRAQLQGVGREVIALRQAQVLYQRHLLVAGGVLVGLHLHLQVVGQGHGDGAVHAASRHAEYAVAEI